MRKRVLSLLLCLVLLLALLPTAALADEENIVNNILLEIVAPEPGHHATAPKVYTGNGSYAVNYAYWRDVADDKDMTAEDKFYGGRTYEAVLDLIVPGVGRFADADQLKVKVGSETLTTSYFEVHDMGSHLIVTYFFKPLPYPTIGTVDVSLPAPEVGTVPSRTLTINDEGPYDTAWNAQLGHEAGVVWTDENGNTPTVFEGGGIYTVTVKLVADAGAQFAWYNDQPDVGVTFNGESVKKVEQLGQMYAAAIQFSCTYPALPGGKPTKIEITTPPNKVSYIEGEAFDPTGIVITATYKDGSTAVVSDDAWEITNNGLNALSPNTTSIWFRLKGTNLGTAQLITVTAIPKTTLTEISVTAEAPAAGAHPNYSLTVNTPGCHIDTSHNTDGFVSGVAWGEMEDFNINNADTAKTLTASDTFSAGKYIVLTFYLQAEKGYLIDSSAKVTFNGKAPFFAFGGGTSFVSMFVFDPLKEEVKPETKIIDAIALTVTAPKVGEKPVYSATAAGPHYDVFTASKEFVQMTNGVGWVEADGPTQQDLINNGKLMTGSDSFQAGKYYYVGVVVKPEEGYSFDPELKHTPGAVTVNGAPCFDFGIENGEGLVGAFLSPVKAEPKALASIAVTAPPTKTEYTAGQAFDPAGMVVTATYSDQTTAAVTGYSVTPQTLTQNDTCVTVSYTEGEVTKTATTPVTVKAPKTLQSIAVTVAPTKTQYNAGQSFDPAGMVVTATYTDYTSSPVTGYTVTPQTLTQNDTCVTVSYTEGDVTKTATTPVTVKAAKTLQSIAVTVAPTKTQYNAGQSFDPAGMVVTASYTDYTASPVTGYTVTPQTLLESDTFVTVSYTENGVTKTATTPVTVKAKEKDTKKDNPFTDVFNTDYFYDAVLWAYYAEPQVTNGMSATEFGPRSTVTRGQAVTFLWRAMGRPEPKSTANPFEDVSPDEYYYKAVLWAVEKGVTRGTDDTHFTPGQTCSTAHIITFLYRTLGIGLDGWGEESAAWASSAGLLAGLKSAVAPGVDCPRCDVVLFLHRAVGK